MATEYKLSYTGAQINEKLGKVDQLETEIADLKENGTGGGSVVSTVEPADDDIPKVFITGVKPTTKDDVLAEMQYVSKSDSFHAYLEIKCQGSSSMSFPKKNFTVKLYSDESRETKQKKMFKDWNHESNKFVLKANWIDHSHARNIVSARIWDEVVKSRSNYGALPEEMRNSPRSGAIDGFPIKLYYNDTYEGIYTWNIGKDDWMWNMNEDNPNHILLSCCYNDNGVLLDKAGNFRALWSGVNEDNWKVEVGTNGDAVKTSLNNLISCVKDTDDDTFKATIGNYLDINSAIDYYLYFWANAGLDSLENNMLLATYDGVKWICGAYDMDSVWGLHYTGQSFIATDFKCPDQYQAPYSLLWERITALFVPELQVRYEELRRVVLSYPNIVTNFERFMDVIGSDLYAEDLTVYTGIPSGSTNNIKQIRNYVRDRLTYVDGEVANMSGEQPDIPCTGVSLNTNTLTFTAFGVQTLTATVTPDGCTDKVTWESNNTSVATVIDGVVTAIANGSAIITATCGAYSDTCAISVTGISGDEVGVTREVPFVVSGGFNLATGEIKSGSGAMSTEEYTSVQEGESYSIDNDGTWCVVCGYDSEKKFVKNLRDGSVTNLPNSIVITIPDGIAYIRWGYVGSGVESGTIKLLSSNNLVATLTMAQYKTIIDGEYVDSPASDTYASGEYIPVYADSYYVYTSSNHREHGGYISVYDINKNAIVKSNIASLTQVTTPSDAAYIRIAVCNRYAGKTDTVYVWKIN